MLVALGMTLVIASRGIDLSVGAVVAVSGALACAHIASAADPVFETLRVPTVGGEEASSEAIPLSNDAVVRLAEALRAVTGELTHQLSETPTSPDVLAADVLTSEVVDGAPPVG